MSKISKIFDGQVKKYNQIYSKSFPKKLLHQEKRLRAELVKEFMVSYLLQTKDAVVVDIGCGIGNVLLSLREIGIRAKMYGVDVSQDMIGLANKNLGLSGYKDINFDNGSIKDISVSGNIVLSLGVMGYQDKQEEFLVELTSVVDNGGYLIFTTSNGQSFLRFARNYMSKLHSLFKGKTKREGVEFFSIKDKKIENLLTKQRFKLEKRVYFTFGLGLFESSIECYIDRLFFKYLRSSFIAKYLSLSVIYVYKKVD